MAFTLLPNLDNLTFDTSIELPPLTNELVEAVRKRYNYDDRSMQMYIRRYSMERELQQMVKAQKALRAEVEARKSAETREFLNNLADTFNSAKESLVKNGLLVGDEKETIKIEKEEKDLEKETKELEEEIKAKEVRRNGLAGITSSSSSYIGYAGSNDLYDQKGVVQTLPYYYTVADVQSYSQPESYSKLLMKQLSSAPMISEPSVVKKLISQKSAVSTAASVIKNTVIEETEVTEKVTVIRRKFNFDL